MCLQMGLGLLAASRGWINLCLHRSEYLEPSSAGPHDSSQASKFTHALGLVSQASMKYGHSINEFTDARHFGYWQSD